jgi:hypothetical protein
MMYGSVAGRRGLASGHGCGRRRGRDERVDAVCGREQERRQRKRSCGCSFCSESVGYCACGLGWVGIGLSWQSLVERGCSRYDAWLSGQASLSGGPNRSLATTSLAKDESKLFLCTFLGKGQRASRLSAPVPARPRFSRLPPAAARCR